MAALIYVFAVLYKDHVSLAGYYGYQLTVGIVSGSQLVVNDKFWKQSDNWELLQRRQVLFIIVLHIDNLHCRYNIMMFCINSCNSYNKNTHYTLMSRRCNWFIVTHLVFNIWYQLYSLTIVWDSCMYTHVCHSDWEGGSSDIDILPW